MSSIGEQFELGPNCVSAPNSFPLLPPVVRLVFCDGTGAALRARMRKEV